MPQPGFFDLDERYQKLSECGDPLEVLTTKIPWESFRPALDRAFRKERKSPAGRKNFDRLLIFKVLVLQSLYNLADAQTEFQIRDRLSFLRFLNLSFEDTVPDEKTIWMYRNHLAERGLITKLFNRFDRFLTEQGYTAKKGMLVDASIVEVPRTRNSREDNETLAAGKLPESWTANPHILRQKDRDARWTKKHGERYYGYKNHINADVKHKLVRRWAVSAASVHDSRAFGTLFDKKNSRKAVWADSAYRSAARDRWLKRVGCENHIHYRAAREHPLSEAKQLANRRRSRIRARVEHVFGFQANSLRAGVIRSIGIVRAQFQIGMLNLTYNLCRYSQLERLRAT